MRARTRTQRRVEAVRQMLKRHRLDGLLATHPASVRYLTGFTGSEGAVVLTRSRLLLVVDFRYFEQAALEAPEATLVHVEAAHYQLAIAEAVAQGGATRLAFEADATSYADFLALTDALQGVAIVPSRGLVASCRQVKDDEEILLMRRAAAITSAAIAAAASTLMAGQTEREVANEINRHIRRLGGEGLAFETLVAFGDHAALPHPRPSDRALVPGDWVLMDAGAVCGGYAADMTRTVVFGQPSDRQREVLDAVERALVAGLAAVRPGAAASDVDRACRQVLADAGLGGYFGHAAGHGVGLELHEEPRLAPESEDVLEAGMVVTVEPGVYLPGWGGCRLEELVLVGREGAQILTATPVGLMHLCTLQHELL